MVFEINLLTILVMAGLGGICTFLANQSIAVFNDGFRPMFPQYFNDQIDRKTLLATSFALSFGLVVGFGLPTSIAGGIIIVHTVMLGCDIIGPAFKAEGVQKWLSLAAGAAFGILLMFGMQAVFSFFEFLPINFLGSLATVGSLIVTTFCVFPALAVAYQAGYKNGVITFVFTLLAKQVTAMYGKYTVDGAVYSINADGIALLVAIAFMVFFAARKKSDGSSVASAAFAIFQENIKRIRKNFLLLALSGGIVALATTLLLIAEGPGSLTATAESFLSGSNDYTSAAMIALGRTLGFIPLVMTTAIISGVYSPAGTKAVHVPAILFINMGILGLVGSFVVGALIMVVEVLLLGYIAKGLDRFPGMKELGDNVRTAMSKILDLALLIGGAIAANAIAPTIGYIWIFGLYFLNQTSKKPVPTMAIGPIGAITLGILINILSLIGLFPAQ